MKLLRYGPKGQEKPGLLDVARLLADDEGQLDLPVGLLRTTGNLNVVVRSTDRGGGLHEDHRCRRHLETGLGRVQAGGMDAFLNNVDARDDRT